MFMFMYIIIYNKPNNGDRNMKPKENKKGYQITLTPSIRDEANYQAEKLNMSLSAYIEEILKDELKKGMK